MTNHYTNNHDYDPLVNFLLEYFFELIVQPQKITEKTQNKNQKQHDTVTNIRTSFKLSD